MKKQNLRDLQRLYGVQPVPSVPENLNKQNIKKKKQKCVAVKEPKLPCKLLPTIVNKREATENHSYDLLN